MLQREKAPRPWLRRAVLAALALALSGPGTAAIGVAPVRADVLGFDTVRLSPSGFEPRVAVGPDNHRWVNTQTAGFGGGPQVVYTSADGHTWSRTPADPPNSQGPCCDNDVVVTPTGRVIVAIADSTTFQILVSYSDDGGATWTASKGASYTDQDREWLAVGPKDPITGQYVVYMLWHNLVSGVANHEMLVSTSRDGGATFLPPVPIATPGSQAWLDLQCADSSGPSSLSVNPRTGQIYAVFGARSSLAGGCGASFAQFEINVIAATRIWVTTSTDEGLTWAQSLAVDDGATGDIVGMQVSPGAVDNAGNFYVVYPESPNPYPDYDGAAVRYRWAPADLSHWSAPVTVASGGLPGHIITQVIAGDAGKLGFFYDSGVAQPGGQPPLWYPTAAETLDGLSASPTITEVRIADIPNFSGTASQLEGQCWFLTNVGPLDLTQPPLNVVNRAISGVWCIRASDVLSMAVDSTCHFMATWLAYGGVPPTAAQEGSYISTQSSGPTLGTSCSVGGLPPA